MKDNNEVNQYVQVVFENVLDKETQTTEIIWGINDMNSSWADGERAIQDKVAEKISELGVNKNSYNTRFKLLNIQDMVKELKSCD